MVTVTVGAHPQSIGQRSVDRKSSLLTNAVTHHAGVHDVGAVGRADLMVLAMVLAHAQDCVDLS